MTTLQLIGFGGCVVSTAINVVLSVRIYREGEREHRAVQLIAESFAETVRSFAPVLQFVVTLRDSPTVPADLRRAAAQVIPRNVTLTREGDTVH